MRLPWQKKQEIVPEKTMIEMYAFGVEVGKGATWLDKVMPNWYKKVDIETLDLGNFGTCALGRTFGKKVSTLLQHDGKFALAHGFMCDYDSNSPEGKRVYAKLTGAWIKEILQRRAIERETKAAIRRARQALVDNPIEKKV